MLVDDLDVARYRLGPVVELLKSFVLENRFEAEAAPVYVGMYVDVVVLVDGVTGLSA